MKEIEERIRERLDILVEELEAVLTESGENAVLQAVNAAVQIVRDRGKTTAMKTLENQLGVEGEAAVIETVGAMSTALRGKTSMCKWCAYNGRSEKRWPCSGCASLKNGSFNFFVGKAGY